jgi:hypothetical protein
MAPQSELNKSTLADLIRPTIATDEVRWCMNPVKLKYAATNNLVTFPSPADDAPAADGQDSTADPPKGFPLIFAEEAYVKWTDQDAYVMELLIGGGYIAVHSGGYEKSFNAPGTPGGTYIIKNRADVDQVIAAIKSRGAVVELTDRGRAEGVWDVDNGFCAVGNWKFYDIDGWTVPAANHEGTIVTHITSDRSFEVKSLGAATGNINAMGFPYLNQQEFSAEKYNDGWRLVTNSDEGRSCARLDAGIVEVG